MTDSSVDLWKTLKIWVDAIQENSELASQTQFVLLTTGRAPEGSASSFLRSSDRDVYKARCLLVKTAVKSQNRETKLARNAFLALAEDEQVSLLSAVFIYDSSPDIMGAYDELCAALSPAAPKAKVDQFVQRLEGWWFSVVIESLRKGDASISLTRIDDKIDELREGFKRENLPVDFADVTVPHEIISEYDKRVFVRQLQLINIGNLRISYAIRDFYRAFHQRSKWIREELLFDSEIAEYELKLEEQWQPRFAELCEDLDTAASDEEKIRSGRKLFRWAEQEVNVPLRTVDDRFLSHGSYHMLADIYRVGWHRDYGAILQGEAESA